MKKTLLLLLIFIGLVLPLGCNLYDNDFAINDEDWSTRKKEYDIVLSVDSSELYDGMTTFCKSYENETGVKIKTDLILPYKGKQERSYLDDLKKVFDLKNAPNIFIVSSEPEYDTIFKSNLAMDLFKLGNDKLEKNLDSIRESGKLVLDDSGCYGLKMSIGDSENEFYYLVVNANIDGIEKKLSLDFLLTLLEKQKNICNQV